MSRIITLFCALILSGCAYWPSGTYFKHGVTQYHGDGTIHDVSQRGLFGSRGYVIELEKFDLGRAYDKQFQLVNLPTIENSRVEIFLAVEGEGLPDVVSIDSFRNKLKAELTASLTNSNGVSVTYFSQNIGHLVWSSPVHGYSGYWLYDGKDYFFMPQPSETYTLRVHYSPDMTLQGKRGCIYLYSGCGGS